MRMDHLALRVVKLPITEHLPLAGAVLICWVLIGVLINFPETFNNEAAFNTGRWQKPTCLGSGR
jgi:hypothetical protein